MTSKLTITDERIAELVAFRPLPGTDINSATRDEWMAMAAELHEHRKADSEPVAWMSKGGTVLNGMRQSAHDFAHYNIPLYRHEQPAPVVMDDTKLRELFDSWFASDCSFDLSPEASEADNIAWRESYWYVWKRCRATMLAAARQSPGSEPATVPDAWIPVSERMPEDRTQVILWDAEIGEVTSGHYSHKTHTFYHCGDAIQNEITHWMLPPCAPQEEK